MQEPTEHNSKALFVSGIPYTRGTPVNKNRLRTTIEQYVEACLKIRGPEEPVGSASAAKDDHTEDEQVVVTTKGGKKKNDNTKSSNPISVWCTINRMKKRLEETAVVVFSSPSDAAKVLTEHEKISSLSSSLANNNSSNNDQQQPPRLVFCDAPLTLSMGAGKIRDHAFGATWGPLKVPHHVISNLQLDSTATFSICDSRTAGRMAKLLWTMCHYEELWNRRTTAAHADAPDVEEEKVNMPSFAFQPSVLDGMACTGGNTVAFMRYFGTSQVQAVELDPIRGKMLEHNIRALSPFAGDGGGKCRAVHIGALQDYLSSSISSTAPADVLYLAPPWGGTDYAETMAETDNDIILQGWKTTATGSSSGGGSATKASCAPSDSSWSVGKFILDTIQNGATEKERGGGEGGGCFKIVASKLPHCFDIMKHIVIPLVHGDQWKPGDLERDFPFRFRFGMHTQLLVVVKNTAAATARNEEVSGEYSSTTTTTTSHTHQATTTRAPHFTNATLSRLVESIVLDWHHIMNLGADDGCRECRPEFYDFEKKRWIMLKNWIDTGYKKKEETRPKVLEDEQVTAREESNK